MEGSGNIVRKFFIFLSLFFFTCWLPIEADDIMIISQPEKSAEAVGILGKLILDRVYTRLGINYRIEDFPHERTLVMADSGIIDGVLLRIGGLEKKYPGLVKVSFPFQYMEVVVFVKDKIPDIRTWNELNSYHIGIVAGFKYAESKTADMDVVRIEDAESGFRMLDQDRIDLLIDLKTSYCLLKELNLDSIKMIEPPLAKIPLYHYLNQKHEKLIIELNEEMIKMEEEGELDVLAEKAELIFQELCGE